MSINISFSYSPTYDEENTDDLRYAPAQVDYSFTVKNTDSLTVDDILYHVGNWLNGCGFVVDPEKITR